VRPGDGSKRGFGRDRLLRIPWTAEGRRRAEIGYTVFEKFRLRGYATEAAKALIQWARHTGERSVFASVAPTNGPSLAVLNRLGFRHVGEQMDEIDGKELVFELGL